jgi:hypothetical protein
VQAEELTWQNEMDVAKTRANKDTIRAKIKLEREKLCDQREWRQDWTARKQATSMVSHLHHSTWLWLRGSDCPYYSLQQFMATTVRFHITQEHHLLTSPSMMTW